MKSLNSKTSQTFTKEKNTLLQTISLNLWSLIPKTCNLEFSPPCPSRLKGFRCLPLFFFVFPKNKGQQAPSTTFDSTSNHNIPLEVFGNCTHCSQFFQCFHPFVLWLWRWHYNSRALLAGRRGSNKTPGNHATWWRVCVRCWGWGCWEGFGEIERKGRLLGKLLLHLACPWYFWRGNSHCHDGKNIVHALLLAGQNKMNHCFKSSSCHFWTKKCQ